VAATFFAGFATACEVTVVVFVPVVFVAGAFVAWAADSGITSGNPATRVAGISHADRTRTRVSPSLRNVVPAKENRSETSKVPTDGSISQADATRV
jgi:hypothetical protein